MPAFSMAIGMLLVWTLGYFFSWRMTAFLSIIPSILQLFLLIPLPETPYWLIEDERPEMARKSLKFFRGGEYDVSEELDEIQKKHESRKANMPQKSWKFTVQRIYSYAFFKPFSCVGVLYVIGTWTGFNSLLVYMITILEDTGSSFDPHIGPIIVGILRLLFAGIVQRRSKLMPRGGFVLQRKEQVRAFQRSLEISPPDFHRHLVIP